MVLTESMEAFGRVSKYQLGKILGIPFESGIKKYFNGRQRPSQLYSIRLVKLWLGFNAGVPIFKMKAIDWDKGLVYCMDGSG